MSSVHTVLLLLASASSSAALLHSPWLPQLRRGCARRGREPCAAERQSTRLRLRVERTERLIEARRTYERWPVGDPQANPRTTRNLPIFRGLRGDVALRAPTYLQDWTEGFQFKTVGATLFLYFACLAPVVAFGGAMQVATQGQLGIVETILSRGVCGMIYATFAGQPMTFVGPTGLTLTFTTALYLWAAPRGVPFLPMYSWVGLWTAFFLLTAVRNRAGNVAPAHA